MARIALVRLRTAHDAELQLHRFIQRALRFAGADSLISQMQRDVGWPTVPQMTLPYLAALIEQYSSRTGRPHTSVIIDASEARAREVLARDGPFDMVWMSANTPAAVATYALSQELMEAGNTTVLGGIHVSVLPDEAASFASTIVTGEGEATVQCLLADWDASRELAPRYDGERVASLAGLPAPKWDAQPNRPLILPVQTSRGCRNACAFCSTTRFQGTRRRHRPVAEIVAEIERHRDAGRLTNTTIFFTDNNIVSDSDHRRGIRDTSYARELFSALIPLDISWAGQGEINLADDSELVELAALSGCGTFLVGFETLDQANLAAVRKPSNSVERYAEQIEVLRRWGISLIGCFIFGMEQDTEAVFDTTFRFIQNHIDSPQLSILTPYPGTALFQKMQREGRLLHYDWSQYDILNVTYRPQHLTPEQLRDGFAALAARTFSMPNMLRRAARFASSVREGPVARQTWSSRMARVLGANLYYRAVTTQAHPTVAAVRSQPETVRAGFVRSKMATGASREDVRAVSAGGRV